MNDFYSPPPERAAQARWVHHLRRFYRIALTYAGIFAAFTTFTAVINYRRGHIAWHPGGGLTQLIVVGAFIALLVGGVIGAIIVGCELLGLATEKPTRPAPLWVRVAIVAALAVAALYFMFRPDP